ncbi:putative phosphotransferase system enzyme IIB component [Vibrio halioticoli NBRC 102217]|uniref:Putative phosphotransferase system enzyme IIB component n=1 Tax=Vibrio halioticoli NBRC 102217 TaxID=1219072 RepID=V5FMG9_9VIBR|nr:PTS sugar transporter subunit IIB [Vibrio halioticoli]GAD90042.1 putative phosphotransferase system enzyme IIB component [Vibrio halioticoli NBRC 102217]
MRIFLCCSAGMSTSMLVKKMKESAAERGIDCTIDAFSISEFETHLAQNDVCLVAPQVKFKFNDFKARADSVGKGCGLIEMANYGMMNGELVLNQAISLYNTNNQ